MSELEPVDTALCQCEKTTYSPFIFGGNVHQVIRCEAEPTTVVTESEPNEQGQHGAMSLCTDHLVVFVNEQGNDMMDYKLQSLADWQSEQDIGGECAA